MKTFRRIQVGVAIAAMWAALTVSDSYESTGKEIFASVVLVMLAGMVIVNMPVRKATYFL